MKQFTLVLTCALLSSPVRGEDVPPVLQGVKLETRLNEQVPLDLVFRDDRDRRVHLRDLFRPEKPVILVLAYYRCPRLCNQVLNGLSEGLRALAQQRGFIVGKELDVVVVSFDPRDHTGNAAAKKQALIEHYGFAADGQGWHFLTGQEREIRRLTQAVGFRYRYDYKSGEYAHASGILLLTPAGRISRVFHDVVYSPSNLYYGLVEASEYRIGNPVRDRAMILFCYSYDPERGKYQLGVINVIRWCALLTVAGLVTLVWRLKRAEHQSSGIVTGAES